MMEASAETETISKQLGFSRTLFLKQEIISVQGKTQRELLAAAKKAAKQGKILLYKATTEELLRFALEKAPIHAVWGTEQLHEKDSVHYVRSGLDQVLCKLAAENKKTIAFSFHDILNSTDRPQLLARIIFNINVCKKYKVKMFFSSFAEDKWGLRSAHDLASLWKVLGGRGKGDLIIMQ